MNGNKGRKREVKSDNRLLGRKDAGIGTGTACLFIVGEIAGAGVLAIPEALKFTGWYFGVCLIVVICLASGGCGVLLGKCWLLLESREHDLQTSMTRNPYSLIGEKACGRVGYVVSMISLVVQLFGGAVVQLLLFAEMMKALVQPVVEPLVHLSFCQWILLSAMILLPFSFFGSPVDFSPIAFFAMSSTTIAAFLIVIACFLTPNSTSPAKQSDDFRISPLTVLLGIGNMNFSFSGASCMPTIQNDMKNKRSFSISVIVAYVILIMIYLPVSAIGYYKFGNMIQSNIVRNLSPSGLTTSIQALLTAHVFCAYLILLNPVNLNLENFLSIQHSFNRYRCLSRILITTLAAVVALSVPKFGKLLNLVGASAVVFQSFILPSFFFIRLRDKQFPLTRITRYSVYAIVFLALGTGIAASGAAMHDLIDPLAFTLPCFLSCSGCTAQE